MSGLFNIAMAFGRHGAVGALNVGSLGSGWGNLGSAISGWFNSSPLDPEDPAWLSGLFMVGTNWGVCSGTGLGKSTFNLGVGNVGFLNLGSGNVGDYTTSAPVTTAM